MLTHNQIWHAIDALAARNGLSPSGLAKIAGLDPTTFNKSKRGGANGKLRWPSTESVSKVLAATNATMEDFVSLIGRGGGPTRTFGRSVPLIGMAQAGTRGFFDDAGFPAGAGWDEIPFPELSDEHAYALEITGESMQPVYRDGDRIVVSPSASVRRGDRVVVKTTDGEMTIGELKRRTARTLELQSLKADHADRSFAAADVAWVARIVWAKQ